VVKKKTHNSPPESFSSAEFSSTDFIHVHKRSPELSPPSKLELYTPFSPLQPGALSPPVSMKLTVLGPSQKWVIQNRSFVTGWFHVA
jgi:hypothetical protein